jgi:hypothetical protein
VKLFYLEGFVTKLMDKNTSLLTRNTAFGHKFHFDRRKWPKKQNGDQITILFVKKDYLVKNNWI